MSPVLVNPSRFASGAGTYAGAVLADLPLFFFKFDEASGTVVNDSSGNGHAGSYLGIPTLGATGLISDGGKAVTLNGSSQFVQVAHGSWMDTVGMTPVSFDYTLELWIKTTATAGFLWSYDDGGGNKVADVQITAAGKIQFTTFEGGTGQSVTGLVTVNNNAAHHIVCVRSGSSMLVYVDGVLDNSGSFGGTFSGDFGFSLPINIGQRGNNSGRFGGTIDMAAYYGTALSSTRVAAHYALR